MSPAAIMVAAGRTLPKYFRSVGQQAGNSAAFGTMYVTLTTSRSVAPACASADSIPPVTK